MFHPHPPRNFFAATEDSTVTRRAECNQKDASTRSVSYVNYVHSKRCFVTGSNPYRGGLGRVSGENFRISVIDPVGRIKNKNPVNSWRNPSELKQGPSPMADGAGFGEQLPIGDQQNETLLEGISWHLKANGRAIIAHRYPDSP